MQRGRRIAAIAIAAVGLPASPAGAAFDGINGELAFSRPEVGATQVWSLLPGTTPFQLTAGAPSADPAYAPAAARLAFTSLRDGNPEIYVVRRFGLDARRLTDHPELDADPAWSRDGDRLAFTSERDGNRELYLTGAFALEAPRRLTVDPGADQQAAWSPKADRIAFESDRSGDREIYTMRPDGTDVVRLTTSPGADADAAWSPDGRRIAFTSDRLGALRLFVMDADGSDQRPLLKSPHEQQQQPAWSPDGREVAFNTVDGDLYTADAGSGTLTYVTYGFDPDWGVLPPPDPQPEPGRTANLREARGTVLVEVAGAETTRRLERAGEIPLDTRIDATRGTAVLTVATTATDTGTIALSRGVATVEQEEGAGHRTVLTMARPPCAGRSRARAARLPPYDRLRVSKSRGTKASVHGRYSRGAGYGTVWTTRSFCRRTVTIVHEGRVVVTDKQTGRRVLVRAGERYTARAR